MPHLDYSFPFMTISFLYHYPWSSNGPLTGAQSDFTQLALRVSPAYGNCFFSVILLLSSHSSAPFIYPLPFYLLQFAFCSCVPPQFYVPPPRVFLSRLYPNQFLLFRRPLSSLSAALLPLNFSFFPFSLPSSFSSHLSSLSPRYRAL